MADITHQILFNELTGIRKELGAFIKTLAVLEDHDSDHGNRIEILERQERAAAIAASQTVPKVEMRKSEMLFWSVVISAAMVAIGNIALALLSR